MFNLQQGRQGAIPAAVEAALAAALAAAPAAVAAVAAAAELLHTYQNSHAVKACGTTAVSNEFGQISNEHLPGSMLLGASTLTQQSLAIQQEGGFSIETIVRFEAVRPYAKFMQPRAHMSEVDIACIRTRSQEGTLTMQTRRRRR